jgi:hypothetical protein
VSDIYQDLKRVREVAIKYFLHVGARESFDSDLWRGLPPSDRQRSEDILAEIHQIAEKACDLFRDQPLLGSEAIGKLGLELRIIDSALRFRQLTVWNTHTEWNEDIPLPVVPAGERENLVSASSAQSIFVEAVDRILRLLRIATARTQEDVSVSTAEAGPHARTDRLLQEHKSVNSGLATTSPPRAERWEDIEISFTSDERVQIRNGGTTYTCNYGELGFEDRRNELPNGNAR